MTSKKQPVVVTKPSKGGVKTYAAPHQAPRMAPTVTAVMLDGTRVPIEAGLASQAAAIENLFRRGYVSVVAGGPSGSMDIHPISQLKVIEVRR